MLNLSNFQHDWKVFTCCTDPPTKWGGREGGTRGIMPPPSTYLFWNHTLPGTFSWEFSFVSFSRTIKTFLAPALQESLRGFCCKNTCGVSDFRIWPKLPQIEITFSLLYRTLLICMIHSCGSKTWIIGFSQLFPICKPYLTDTNLGGCIFSHFQWYRLLMVESCELER